MSSYAGPAFRLVETITREEFARHGGLPSFGQPCLVKGGVSGWPAWENWSFERFAALAGDTAREAVATFQNGLVEQGPTRPPLERPLAPYMHQLGLEAAQAGGGGRALAGLCSDSRLAVLGPGDAFQVDWGFLRSFQPNKVYLAQWDLLRQFPVLRQDLRLDLMWRHRRNYPYIWVGPANTVTGLHTDYPDNWFCQFRGEKEFLLFSPDDDRFMSRSSKYDFGAKLSQVDVMRLDEGGPAAARFARARGIYARVRPGDALFVPKHTWHCVVSLEPAISLSVFGLTIGDMIREGPKRIGLDVLHYVGLYRKGNCTCHGHGARAGRYG